MLDLTFIDLVAEDYDNFVPRLIDKVRSKGGVAAEQVLIHPREADRISREVNSPWYEKYFGIKDLNSIVKKAMKMADGVKDPDAPQPLRDMASLLQRQATRNDVPYINPLEAGLSCIDRFFWLHETLLLTDADIYSVGNAPETFVKHNTSYLYKWGLLSMYNPDIWYANAEAYGVHRQLNLSDEDVDVLAEAIVALQQMFGLIETVGRQNPMSLADTNARAKSNNPISAFSLPTMKNAKDKDAVDEVLELAEEYKENPEIHGNMAFNGQKRVQQGGNVFDIYLNRLYPQIDWDLNYPTRAQLEECLDFIRDERPDLMYYSKHDVVPNKWVNSIRLPESVKEREALVEQGVHSEAILKKSDGDWRFNYQIFEANIFMLRMDKDENLKGSAKYDHWNKNRVVFAGSGPVARVKQSFVYVWYDYVKQYAGEHGFPSIVAQWKEPAETRKMLTNMHAAVNHLTDYNGNDITLSDTAEKMFGKITGDDKSAFDNFQSIIFGATYYSCIFAPMFEEKYYNLIKHLSLQTTYPMLVTYKGVLRFAESMPSGDGVTNLQDTYITLIAGMFSMWRRTGIRPLEQMKIYKETNAGPSGQGDDYIGVTNSNTTPEDLVGDYSDIGLVVSGPKSLMDKNSFEYLRQESSGNFHYFPKRTLRDKSSKYRLLAVHAPIAHMAVKLFFLETHGELTAAEGEIAQINRLANSELHSKFDILLTRFYPLTKFGLGIKSVDYMPNYKKKDWIADGRPKDTSKYMEKVDSPMKLLEVASKEAAFKKSSLKRDIGVNYQEEVAETNFEEGFPALRIVQYIEAIRLKNNDRIRELNSQIVSSAELNYASA